LDKHLHRIKGRAKRGKKVKKKHPGKRFKRRNVIAGLCGNRVLAPCTYGWKTDSIWFAEWFEFCLIPCLLVNSVIIMDNASFHSKTVLETIAETYGHKIIWLPKYSPDKNPIEKLWANMKKWLRSFSQNYAIIQRAIFEYFLLRHSLECT
jgi:transposase